MGRQKRTLGVVVGAGILALLLVATTGQAASTYPDRPITIVVPFGAGGSADTLARGLAKYWQKALGVPMQVVDKPGAGGIEGAMYFLSQPDDGYTIFVGTDPYLTTGVFRGGGYKYSDFWFINIQQFDPVDFIVLKSSPYQTLNALISAIKAHPDQISWGTPVGGPTQVVADVMFQDLGLKTRFVPFNSGATSKTALLGGQVDFTAGTVASDLRAIGDKGQILAVATKERSSLAPNVPTFDEVLASYNASVPSLGSSRFVAVQTSFKEKYPSRYNMLVNTYRQTLQSQAYRDYLKQIGTLDVTRLVTPQQANAQAEAMYQSMEKYKNILLGNQ